MTVFRGLCYAHSEQGMEHTALSLQAGYDQEYWSYDDLHQIEPGDSLVIRNQWGLVEWAGVIDFKDRYFQTQRHGVVNGVQRGVDPELWASYFTWSPKGNFYTGELVKNEKEAKLRKERQAARRAAQAQASN